MRFHNVTVAATAVLGLVVASCSSSNSTTSGSTTTTQPPAVTSTTIDAAAVAAAAQAYTAAGPYPVGVRTATLPSGVKVEIWYPAVAGSTGTETYDAREFTDPAIRALLTADIPATHSYSAARDAAVADGKFPVVLNSHGFSGWRSDSSFLTSHLASWGMIVVSPDHKSRDLLHLASNLASLSTSTSTSTSTTTTATVTSTTTTATGTGTATTARLGTGDSTPTTNATDPTDPKRVAALNESVAELLGGLDYITAQSSASASPFKDHIDLDHVGALGHSAGGGTILKAALDPRIDGYVSMASGIFANKSDLPQKPSFFLSGEIDQIAATANTHDAFLAVPAPSLFWRIGGAGHNAFDDICTLGAGKGIIGIAEASGLGPLLDSTPLIRKLGMDGCVPPAEPVETTFPIIDHAITAWFLNLFGIDAKPKGLDTAVTNSYAVKLTIEQR